MSCKDHRIQFEVLTEEELAMELVVPDEEHDLDVPHADLPEQQEYPDLPNLYEEC